MLTSGHKFVPHLIKRVLIQKEFHNFSHENRFHPSTPPVPLQVPPSEPKQVICTLEDSDMAAIFASQKGVCLPPHFLCLQNLDRFYSAKSNLRGFVFCTAA